MRGSTKKTPTATKKAEGGDGGDSNDKMLSAEKTSGKKLKQARLPFKIIASGTDEGGRDATTVGQTDTRKRKLSYDNESEQTESETTENSKENVSAVTTKKPKTAADDTAAVAADVVVVLDDSSDDDETKANATDETKNKKSSKQTPKSVKGRQSKSGAGTPKQSKLGAGKKANESAKKTPKREVNVKNNETPKASKDEDDVKKTPKQPASKDRRATPKKDNTTQNDDNVGDTATSTPTPTTHQNKRRKSLRNLTKVATTPAKPKEHTDSSDDIEAIAIEHNPQKRIKVAVETDEKTEEKTNIVAQNAIPNVLLEISDDNVTKITSSSSEELELNTTKADDASNSDDAPPDTKKANKTLTNDKNLTPKQQKLLDQRRKAREEKERKLQQEKEQKQREKEERENAKKLEREQRDEQRRKEREEKEEQRRKEREEKDEQKRKEREEKDEQKRLEREEKERKRVAEQEAKNEEKRKKEEVEQKKKREAAAFTKFFLPKTTTNSSEQQSRPADDAEATQLAFQPFQVKGDMKLAPIKRNSINTEARNELDQFFVTHNTDTQKDDSLSKSQLYLCELRAGIRKASKWSLPTTESVEEDVMIVEDDLARVGQAIDEEEKRTVERLRAKFLKFHENRRPAYYGTWRKRTTQISARRPFAQDTKYLDYEVESDLEWEEEEPGESLDGSCDEKDKESEDDEYEVDNEWFVPHGHLSDEELQNDEEFDDGNTREAQQAKLQILQQEFAQEMRKETKKIKPRLIGCIWVDVYGKQPAECPSIIWETLDKRTMLCNGPISLDEPKPELNETESSSPPVEKVKAIVLTSELQKELARLIHGNKHSKNFLINEYIAYLGAHVDAIKIGEALLPSKSMVREQIEDFAEWKVTEVAETQTTNNNNNNGNGNGKKQKKPKKLLCWIVSDEVLTRLELTMLTLENCWSYITTPKFTTTTETKDMKTIEPNNKESKVDDTNKDMPPIAAADTKSKKNKPPSIANYTKVLTPTIESKTKIIDAQTNKTASATPTAANTKQTNKKRVPLLMSVPRGEQIPTAAKNALINRYLKKDTTTTKSSIQITTRAVIEQQPPALADDDDDIIMLD